MAPLFIQRRSRSFMGVGLLLSLSLGCAESTQELYSNARQATEAKRFDEAIKLYSEMTKDPQATVEVQYQSRFGTSEVYLAQGALDAQAKVLEELTHNPAMKDYMDTLVIKLEENYLHRAEVLGLGDSTQLTELLQKAIKLNPNSSARRLLVEHYVAWRN
jgi:exopolyphosphatase/pppGpp-phosphohydrolase